MDQFGNLLLSLYSRSFTTNPYRIFRLLRQVAPIWRVPTARWMFRHYDWILTRYEDCALVLRDRRFGAAEPEELLRRFGPTAAEEPSARELANIMAAQNPPDHARLRSLMNRPFTSRKVEYLRRSIQDTTDRLLDQVALAPQMDVVKDLALPLSTFAICQILGIPEGDRERLMAGLISRAVLVEPTRPSRSMLDTANSATVEGRIYFQSLLEKRRRCPKDDLVTHLLLAHEDDNRLSQAELLANLRFLLIAGHETTVNLIGSGLLALLRNQTQWEALRRDPALVPNAVEEMLRYDAPVQAVPRVVLEPVVLSGIPLKPREVVAVVLGAANRDDSVFVHPDQFDVTRKNIKSLSFGAGIHFCLGAQLVRLEAAVVLETLLRRFPHLQLTKAGRPNWRPNVFLRGLAELPVTWS